ncbi:ABC transporter substrate-binding protein [Klebsiella quasipneumoniae subsp. similipneumoniae]
MVAARQADLAITYRAAALFADEGLPLVRVGLLINSPLNTAIAPISRSVKPRQIWQGKKVGYWSAALSRLSPWRPMAQHAGIDPPASNW